YMKIKKVIIYIVIPIVLAMLSYFISTSFIFKIPDPSGIGYTPVTYYFALKLSIFVLGISSIVSAILYVGRKNKH
ncbi:MAG: hypothetical protein K2O73_04920, partial [Lachnospiraceae bacterium]|nr:hypothetical protein [Lachnospiraceae bacterium]